MAKRKKPAALFDVVSTQRDPQAEPVQVPNWAGQSAGGPSAGPAGRMAGRPLKQPPGLGGGEGGDAPPLVQVHQGRLYVSLNTVGAMVAALGLVLLLVGAWALGHSSAQRDTPVGAGGLDRLASTERTGPFDANALQAQHKARTVGWLYLKVQPDVPNLQDALAIQEYLWNNGIDATVVPAGANRYDVVDLKGFVQGGDEANVRAGTLQQLGQRPNWVSRYPNYRFEFENRPSDKSWYTHK